MRVWSTIDSYRSPSATGVSTVGMDIAPQSGIDDRRLDIYAIEMGRHRDLIGLPRYLKTGDFIRNESVSHFRTEYVRLETEPDLPINIDREVVRVPHRTSPSPTTPSRSKYRRSPPPPAGSHRLA
jgi:YegS C-terminal NAD kinase beta sandwich-like domain